MDKKELAINRFQSVQKVYMATVCDIFDVFCNWPLCERLDCPLEFDG